MKNLIILFAVLLIVSCSDKKESDPIKVIFHELEFQDSQYSLYHFTARNESDAIVESFTIETSLFQDGSFIMKDTRTINAELVPFQTVDYGVVFEFATIDSLVTFKYKFK